jgi:hypothetical protein
MKGAHKQEVQEKHNQVVNIGLYVYNEIQIWCL